jgi:hypothetical protein
MKITMTVQMDPRGFGLSAMSDDGRVSREDLNRMNITIAKTKTGFDFEKLTQTLLAIKTKFPKSDTMIFVPDRELTYDEMIKGMDAAREIRVSDSSAPNGKKYLFPNVVVSSTVE